MISRRSLFRRFALGVNSDLMWSDRGSATPGVQDQPVDAMLFQTIEDISLADVPNRLSFLFVFGRDPMGFGRSIFRRASREPAHPGKVRSRNGVWWELSPGSAVNVCQFGAWGDGHHDDTTAIQAAIDYALYTDRAPKTVVIPALSYLVSDTIQIGYGDSFVSLTIVGSPNDYSNSAKRSGIFAEFNDKPCVNIQGGRRIRVKGLSIFGVNRNHLAENHSNILDRSDRAAWFGPRLGRASESRHAPYCGICIDAYSGPAPSDRYPAVSYPGSRVQKQYGKNFSSDVILEDCRIEGFSVGVAVQPGQVPDASNGDFITYRDCVIAYNVVGISDSHADSRCNNIINSKIHTNHTAIENVRHGPGAAMFIALLSGCCLDRNYRIIDIDLAASKTQGAYPLKFENCYGEDIGAIGVARASFGGSSGISFENCKYEFSVRPGEISPVSAIRCDSGTVVFRNCVLQGGIGFSYIQGDTSFDGVVFDHVQVDIFDTKRGSGRLARSYTTGFLARSSSAVRVRPTEFFDLDGGLVSGQYGGQFDSERFNIRGSHRHPIPWWVREILGAGRVPIEQEGPRVFDKVSDPAKGEAGCEYDMVIDVGRFDGSTPGWDYWFGAGDIIEDIDTGICAYVVQVKWGDDPRATGMRLRVRQLNGILVPDGNRGWELGVRIDGERGKVKYHNARRYCLGSGGVVATVGSGERVMHLRRRPVRGHVPEDLLSSVGDYLETDQLWRWGKGVLFTKSKVESVGADKASLTFATPAKFDFQIVDPLFVKSAAT